MYDRFSLLSMHICAYTTSWSQGDQYIIWFAICMHNCAQFCLLLSKCICLCPWLIDHIYDLILLSRYRYTFASPHSAWFHVCPIYICERTLIVLAVNQYIAIFHRIHTNIWLDVILSSWSCMFGHWWLYSHHRAVQFML